MRVATWNINGLRARLDFVIHWLRARQPDVVGLQELKSPAEEFPHMALEAEGYRAVVHGQKAWNGVAVLTRDAAECVQEGLPGQDELGARLLTVRVAGLEFTTVYCPNGKTVEHDDYPLKLAWFDALAEYLGAADESSARVLCGDFNICPRAIDSWREDPARIFHTVAERARFDRLVENGWIDVFRARYPDEKVFSWWDYRSGAFHRNMGLRIDMILGSAAFAARVSEVWVDRDYRKKKDGLTASDHAPVIADLD